MKLADKHWEKIKDLIPDGKKKSDGKGRPWRDKRDVLDGILWILKTEAQWSHLPPMYPPYQTCHRRFQPNFIRGKNTYKNSATKLQKLFDFTFNDS